MPLRVAILCLLPFARLMAQPSFTGVFATDDQVKIFVFELSASTTVTMRTLGFAGGVNADGVTVPSGGFDPVLTLFDAAGHQIASNDDAGCAKVNPDFATRNCFDSFLSLQLGPGTYSLTLTQADNLATGETLAEGFSQSGRGNFTCIQFMNQPGGFCDASPSQRTNAWALDIVGADSVKDASPLPSHRRPPPRT